MSVAINTTIFSADCMIVIDYNTYPNAFQNIRYSRDVGITSTFCFKSSEFGIGTEFNMVQSATVCLQFYISLRGVVSVHFN